MRIRTRKRIEVAIQYAAERDGLPSPADFRRWIEAAAPDGRGEVAVRLVALNEGRRLNREYRGKDSPTNVLSFAYEEGAGRAVGDLVLCTPVVADEAAAQGKPLADHYAHLVVHGVLHLLGYDHENDVEAGEMESRERVVLAGLGVPDPYAGDA